MNAGGTACFVLAQSTSASRSPSSAGSMPEDAAAADGLLGGKLSHPSQELPPAQFELYDYMSKGIDVVIKAVVSPCSAHPRRLSLFAQYVHIARAIPPGAPGRPTLETINSLDWSAGLETRTLRLFMDLLLLLPFLAHLSIGPNLRAPSFLHHAMAHKPYSLALPKNIYQFSLTSLSCGFILDSRAVLLLVKSSLWTLTQLTLRMNTSELCPVITDLPELPELKRLVVQPANGTLPGAYTRTLLRRCPRLERVHLRADYHLMEEAAIIALEGSPRLRTIKLSSLQRFDPDERAQQMLRRLSAARLPCLRQLELTASSFDPAILSSFRAECAVRRIIVKAVTLSDEEELLYL